MHRLLVLISVILSGVAQTLLLCDALPTQNNPQVGNGYVAGFISQPWEHIGGVFNGFNTTSHRAAFPTTLGLNLLVTVSAPGRRTEEAMLITDETAAPWTLDHETASASRLFWVSGFQCSQGVFVSRARRHISVNTVTCQRSQANATAAATLTIAVAEAQSFTGLPLVDVTVANQSTSGAVNATTYTMNTAEESEGTPGAVTPWPFHVTYVSLLQTELQFSAAQLGPLNTSLPTARCTSHSEEEPNYDFDTNTCAHAAFSAAMSAGAHHLWWEHLEMWSGLWHRGAEVITADGQGLHTIVAASWYALLTSLSADWPFSTSPGGLSTNGYNGHAFWDMETWMFPNLLLFYRDLAVKSAMAYRLHRIPGAQAKAASLGYQGAMFPWESGETGYEVCPWPPGSLTEIHITADIAFAWQQFAYTSGCTNTTLQTVWPLINQTSRFWASRATPSTTIDGRWHITGVTPPDEYHNGVTDSVYTNHAVQTILRFAVFSAVRLAASGYPDLPSNDTLKHWKSIADGLVIVYNATEDYHPEFAGYEGHTRVKQADVILTNFPWSMTEPTQKTAHNDLLYYENRTDPLGPAMTWSMFAVGFAQHGDQERAASYFTLGYVKNCFPPYFNWYEVAGGEGCPNFVTGAGGFLQSIWAGIGGLRITPTSLIIHPFAFFPDANVTGLKLRKLSYLGNLIDVAYRRTARHGHPGRIHAGKQRDYDIRVSVSLSGQSPINGVPLAVNRMPITRMPRSFLLSQGAITIDAYGAYKQRTTCV